MLKFNYFNLEDDLLLQKYVDIDIDRETLCKNKFVSFDDRLNKVFYFDNREDFKKFFLSNEHKSFHHCIISHVYKLGFSLVLISSLDHDVFYSCGSLEVF